MKRSDVRCRIVNIDIFLSVLQLQVYMTSSLLEQVLIIVLCIEMLLDTNDILPNLQVFC